MKIEKKPSRNALELRIVKLEKQLEKQAAGPALTKREIRAFDKVKRILNKEVPGPKWEWVMACGSGCSHCRCGSCDITFFDWTIYEKNASRFGKLGGK
jgi:hypothetical protein